MRELGKRLASICAAIRDLLYSCDAGGQFFNMFNLGKTEDQMFKLKTNEIRNGRLAMLAMLGYGAQVRLQFVWASSSRFVNLVQSQQYSTLQSLLWL